MLKDVNKEFNKVVILNENLEIRLKEALKRINSLEEDKKHSY